MWAVLSCQSRLSRGADRQHENDCFNDRRQKAPRFQLIVLNRIPSEEGTHRTIATNLPNPLPTLETGERFDCISLSPVCADQLKEDILDDFEFELSPPYLLYRNKNEVNGVWANVLSACPSRTIFSRQQRVNYRADHSFLRCMSAWCAQTATRDCGRAAAYCSTQKCR